MLPHLNLKVDRFTVRDPFLQEILHWMNRRGTMATGKLLGHDVNWTVLKNAADPRCEDGYLTFEFESEADKILFILKKL